MTEKELLVTKKIERICRHWFENFKIEHKNNDIIFTMEQPAQECLHVKREYHFASKGGREFCYYGYLYYEDDKVVFEQYPQYPSGIILHIFAQVCDALDGLLESYYVKQ